MTPLANALYQVLRIRTPKPIARKATIGYPELVAELFRYEGIPTDLNHHADPRVDAALLELQEACKLENLPLVTALVLGTQERHSPSEAYFKSAHPQATTPDAKSAAWEKELREVAMTFYPASLKSPAVAS